MEKCKHCGIKFNPNNMITNKNGFKFCCNGCLGVYELINDSGLSEFYERLGDNELSPVKSNNKNQDYQEYVKDEGKFKSINLIISDMHCFACQWLIQKILYKLSGVLEVNISMQNNKAKIIFKNDENTNIKEILKQISKIGYTALPYDPRLSESRLQNQRREYYIKILVAIFCTMNIMWLAIAKYSAYFSEIDKEIKDILNFCEFILASICIFFVGSIFFKGALKSLKAKSTNMDLLVASGVGSSYLYSIYAMFTRTGEVYFDSVTMIICFVFIGKFLELISKKKASDTIDSLSYNIDNNVLVLENNKEITKKANEVKIGENIVLKAGSKAIIDGEIINGGASFDYSSLSGESVPIYLSQGDQIKSASLCLDGKVIYKSTSNFENSTLSKILNLLENANSNKPKLELLANKIASKFSFWILFFALLTFVLWFNFSDFNKALLIGVSVIIIACPCALALATPISSIVALNLAFKKGLVFKKTNIIQSMANCNSIVFDKTGTLTKGKLKLVNKIIFSNSNDENLIISLLSNSKHPMAKAICKNYQNFKKINNIKEIAAKGIMGEFEGKKILAGSSKFMKENGICIENNSNYSCIYGAIDNNLIIKFELEDELRDEAKSVINELKKMKFEIYILSGDIETSTTKIAKQLNIDNFYFETSPEFKAEFIENLKNKNKKVLMVGDGLNDALAISGANVAICMGSGSDISIEKSDAVLLKNDLKSLLLAIKISKLCITNIKQNLAFSILYNITTIPLAMAGYIVPLIAALSMSFSSVIVILNALRINLKEIK